MAASEVEPATGVQAGVIGRDVDGVDHAADERGTHRVDRQARRGDLRHHLAVVDATELLELAADVERAAVEVERVDLTVARELVPLGLPRRRIEDGEATRERATHVEHPVRIGRLVGRAVRCAERGDGHAGRALNAARLACWTAGAPSSGSSVVPADVDDVADPASARLSARRIAVAALRGQVGDVRGRGRGPDQAEGPGHHNDSRDGGDDPALHSGFAPPRNIRRLASLR
jgi:hypothetical protein